eukprot:gene6512-8808_t
MIVDLLTDLLRANLGAGVAIVLVAALRRLLYGRSADVAIEPAAIGQCTGTTDLMVNVDNPTVSTASSAFAIDLVDGLGDLGRQMRRALGVARDLLDDRRLLDEGGGHGGRDVRHLPDGGADLADRLDGAARRALHVGDEPGDVMRGGGVALLKASKILEGMTGDN